MDKKPLRFKDFDTVDYTGTGDEELASKASRRKKIDNEEVQDEALSMTQRLARGRQMKKLKSKIALGRKRAMRKTANLDTLKKRAKKQARNMIAKKLTKGVSKGDLNMARRMEIEKRLDKMKPKIDKLAKKLLPIVRKQELARKKGKGKEE